MNEYLLVYNGILQTALLGLYGTFLFSFGDMLCVLQLLLVHFIETIDMLMSNPNNSQIQSVRQKQPCLMREGKKKKKTKTYEPRTD